jgi:hypothetical protein
MLTKMFIFAWVQMIVHQQKRCREKEILGVRNAKEIKRAENYKLLNSKNKTPTDSWILRMELKDSTDRGMVSGLGQRFKNFSSILMPKILYSSWD